MYNYHCDSLCANPLFTEEYSALCRVIWIAGQINRPDGDGVFLKAEMIDEFGRILIRRRPIGVALYDLRRIKRFAVASV